jgi:hypothetical protein
MKKNFKPVEMTLEEALDCSTLVSLREEIEAWHDNLPESLQSGDKASALEECMQALEDADADLELTPWLRHLRLLPVKASCWKRATSRSKQRDDVVNALAVAKELLEDKSSKYSESMAKAPQELPTDTDGTLETRAPITVGEFTDCIDEIASLTAEIEQVIEAAENAEFPGMYG